MREDMPIEVLRASDLSKQQLEDWASHLCGNGSLDNPFFRPEYAQFASRVFSNIEVAVISDGQSTPGYFAFERQSNGVGVAIGRFLSDLHGVVCNRDLQWDADSLIRGCGLSAWRFDHLLAEQTTFQKYHSYVDESYFMDLRGGYEAYCEQRRAAGSSAIKQAARKQRKLEREVGPVRFVAHTTDEKIWQTLADLKSAQLLKQGYSDMFRLEWIHDLLAELRTVDEPSFGPLLSVLYAGDRMLAVHLALRSPGVVSSWIPTFDSEYSKYSPGLILHLELAEWAARQDVYRIDLCRGENQMKLSLASDAFDVAVGAVDHRFVHRTLTRSYYGLRNLVHASPFSEASMKAVRRIKAFAGK